ncbi:MAG: glyoxylate/hydroxypyruvate reductase A [Alphaproteobacteria bacterium]|nr:glyoxylate/hydroxypyruvate reductase A [Beijerinckiaceae bacterium]NBQ38990.1 glyoxylate/hydroxypyruvate reductase A [Alphaproteobacteria bacterium]
MTLLVALGSGDPDPWVKQFRALLPDRPIVKLGDSYDPASIEFAMTWYHPPGSLAHYPHLKAVFSMGAGVDHLFRDTELPDVAIARVVDPDLTNRMSEYVILHALSIMRQTRRYREQQNHLQWIDDDWQPAASEVRVGVMGLGVLGSDAAQKLKHIGFKVAGWSRSPKSIDGIQCFSGDAGLSSFLARTDILVVLLPLTDETRGIINRKLLKGLARDGRVAAPSLINAGRGNLQIETELLECLDDDTLHEAVLDVFQTEPLPETSPLWTHPRVTITPHNASVSDPVAIANAIAAQIKRVEKSEPLLNTVSRAKGY